jgi:dienelactone hydrolase
VSTLERTAAAPGVFVHEAKGTTRAVVVMLHGGRAESLELSEPKHLSSRRMLPFAWSLRRRGAAHGVAVWRVRYRVRGWNGEERSPVADARWALDRVREQHGDVPVVLFGHSMGGRTAVNVLDDPQVKAALLLAPWLPHEPIEGARDKSVLVVHGAVDKWTSPRQSREWAEKARPLARVVTYIQLKRTGHFMLRRARLWTDLAVGFSLTELGVDVRVGRRAQRLLEQARREGFASA